MASDSENKEALFRLLRFQSKASGERDLISIDDYIDKMKDG